MEDERVCGEMIPLSRKMLFLSLERDSEATLISIEEFDASG